jgi:hypothetical protein
MPVVRVSSATLVPLPLPTSWSTLLPLLPEVPLVCCITPAQQLCSAVPIPFTCLYKPLNSRQEFSLARLFLSDKSQHTTQHSTSLRQATGNIFLLPLKKNILQDAMQLARCPVPLHHRHATSWIAATHGYNIPQNRLRDDTAATLLPCRSAQQQLQYAATPKRRTPNRLNYPVI